MQPRNTDYLLLSIVVILAAVCISCSLSDRQGLQVKAQTNNVNQNQIDKFSASPSPSPLPPKILSRKEWKAKDAVGEMRQHTIKHVTIHHTASPQKEGITLEKKMQSLQNFSQGENRLASGKTKPAWPDVPYHYYIAIDGQIAEGREIKYVGDTNTDYDPSGHALIVLEGNFEEEKPTARQLEALLKLIAWLSSNYEIPVSEIKGHNDYAATACPGTNLKKLLSTLRQGLLKPSGP